MWCIETIIELNQKALEMYIEGRHLAEAYSAVGINAEFKADKAEICTENEFSNIVSHLQENKDVEVTSSRWI